MPKKIKCITCGKFMKYITTYEQTPEYGALRGWYKLYRCNKDNDGSITELRIKVVH